MQNAESKKLDVNKLAAEYDEVLKRIEESLDQTNRNLKKINGDKK